MAGVDASLAALHLGEDDKEQQQQGAEEEEEYEQGESTVPHARAGLWLMPQRAEGAVPLCTVVADKPP
jgi:hypothetical protein